MNKLNVGDYAYITNCRKYGIGKIYKITENNNIEIEFKNHLPKVSVGNVKSSPNIIDLIEVGDYVNGYKVIDIVKGFKVIIDKLEVDTTIGLYHNIGIANIETIVTKEQFENISYKVGE